MKKRFLTLYAVYVGKELCSVHFSKKGVPVKIYEIHAGKFGKFLIDEFIKSC